MEEPPPSLSQVIDLSSCEVLERIRDPETLVRLMSTSRELRAQVQDCARELEIPEGTAVPASFVLSLPNVSRVSGTILIDQPRNIPRVSSRIRGSLSLLYEFRGDIESLSQAQARALGHLAEVLIDIVRVRALLYPESETEVRFPGVDLHLTDSIHYRPRYLEIRWLSSTPELLRKILQHLPPLQRLDFYEEMGMRDGNERSCGMLLVSSFVMGCRRSGSQEESS